MELKKLKDTLTSKDKDKLAKSLGYKSVRAVELIINGDREATESFLVKASKIYKARLLKNAKTEKLKKSLAS